MAPARAEPVIFGGRGPSRALTGREVALARTVFGDAIRYDAVRVHGAKYVFFQPGNVAMTPNGAIYFPPATYKPDFATTLGDAGWLLHELTHVWQWQCGVWVKLRAPFSRNYHYGSPRARARYGRFNIEQQAAMVEDYFRLTHGAKPVHGAGPVEDYRAVIPFLPRG